MTNKLLDIKTDLQQIAKLKTKFEKYPPYAIGEGLDAVADFLNSEKFDMYPPESDAPFVWSSEKQRRAYFATDGFGEGIPYRRRNELDASGEFRVDKKYSSLYIYYTNEVPYAKFVIGQGTQIIGMIARGWKPSNVFVIDRAPEVIRQFQTGVAGSWERMKFMEGGAAGL